MVDRTIPIDGQRIRLHVEELGGLVFRGATTRIRDAAFDELVMLSRDPSIGRAQVEVGLELGKIQRKSSRLGTEAEVALAEMKQTWADAGV